MFIVQTPAWQFYCVLKRISVRIHPVSKMNVFETAAVGERKIKKRTKAPP